MNILFIVVMGAPLLIDLVINILVVALFLLYLVLFFVAGFAYSIVIPIGTLALGVAGLIRRKSITNIIILILNICLVVTFYVAIYN